jgi:PIN domain nuclease of toxin-antitoxin system
MLSAEVAVDAGSIPRTAVADPLDRLIVATARQLDATLLTADVQLLSYARTTKHVRVQDAGA